jgi:hypothetical protein
VESLFPPDRRHGDPIGALPLCDLARVYGKPYAIDLARGAGGLLRRFARTMGASEDVAQALREILGSDEPLAPYVAEGLCLEFAYPLARQTGADLAASRALRTLVPEPHRAAWTRGFGLQCGRAIGRGIPSDVKAALAAAREVAVGEEDDFWLGVGWGLADQAEDPPSAAELARLLADVPRERRARACEGFGRALRHLAGAPIAAPADAAGAGLAPEELAGLERGARWDGYPAR